MNSLWMLIVAPPPPQKKKAFIDRYLKYDMFVYLVLPSHHEIYNIHPTSSSSRKKSRISQGETGIDPMVSFPFGQIPRNLVPWRFRFAPSRISTMYGKSGTTNYLGGRGSSIKTCGSLFDLGKKGLPATNLLKSCIFFQGDHSGIIYPTNGGR